MTYDLGVGSKGLQILIQSQLTTLRKLDERSLSQVTEHKSATEIYKKHDPSYSCMCSYCRV